MSPSQKVVMDYLQMSEEEEEMDEPLGTLSGRMKAMGLESWLRMLSHVLTFLLSYLRCVKVGECVDEVHLTHSSRSSLFRGR